MITKHKKHRLNPMLLKVLLISGGLHLVALFILGGITIVKYIIPDEADFEEPPAIVEEEPPPEIKIEIKQKPNQQPSQLNNLQMKPVSNIAVDTVDVELPDMADSFTVSAGLGGTGSGNLLGGTRGSIGMGMSDVSVFGLKTRAERILFCVDIGREMVTDKKGGLNSFNVIRDEITDMVGNLSAGTLFNVMLIDRRRTTFFKPATVPAGKSVHQELVSWIVQYNTSGTNVGLENFGDTSYTFKKPMPSELVYEAYNFSGNRENETARLHQIILEQNIDAAFIITGFHRGFENIRRRPTESENAEWERHTSSSKYQKQLAKHKTEVEQMRQRITNEMKKINAQRASRGQPPRVLSSRHGVYSDARELELRWSTPHPGWQPPYFIQENASGKYFRQFIETNYTEKEATPPSINLILFLAGDEVYREQWEDSMKRCIRFFKGKSRIIRGEDEIKSARSAKETFN